MGAALARLRRARRLTGKQLAARLGMSQPKISRIERGHSAAPEDVGAIARALGASETETQALMERAERAHDRVTDWRPTTDGLANRQDTLADWELKATEVRDFQPALLTGLLQHEDYARAALSAFLQLRADDQQQLRGAALMAAVAARLRRQRALEDSTKTFHFVFSEWVLRNRICEPVKMLAQIGKLRELNEKSNVTLAIIPDVVEVPLPAMHGFVLYDDDLVVIDLFNTGLTTRGRHDVVDYRQIFDLFARHATGDVRAMLDHYYRLYLDQVDRPSGQNDAAAAPE